MRLYEFLVGHEAEILAFAEAKIRAQAGALDSSLRLREAMPDFYQHLLSVLALSPQLLAGEEPGSSRSNASQRDKDALSETARGHGEEMLRLGYTLSQVVHSYGALCQAITELAVQQGAHIDVTGFRDLNVCLDVAIAGAVSAYQHLRNSQVESEETAHLGYLAHELRNALSAATIAMHLAKKGTVGLGGSTGQVLERNLKRMELLIDRSLTEVRLRVDPALHAEPARLLHVVDQILVTAGTQAEARGQTIATSVDPSLIIDADQQAFYSALSNLIQNALKFSRDRTTIQVRAREEGENLIVEVEDQCGGMEPKVLEQMFHPYKQHHQNREGMGLGLTISRRAIELNRGQLEARTVPGRGCIFTITLPRAARAA